MVKPMSWGDADPKRGLDLEQRRPGGFIQLVEIEATRAAGEFQEVASQGEHGPDLIQGDGFAAVGVRVEGDHLALPLARARL
jgi:hypothetical protein